MMEFRIEELEERIAPDTLSVTIPAATGQSGLTTVPPGGATVNPAAEAANGANGVTVVP